MNEAFVGGMVVAALLFATLIIVPASVLILAHGARAWMDAAAGAARARSHRMQADAQEAIDTQALDAAEAVAPKAERRRVTDEELVEVLRASRNGHVETDTTLGEFEPDANPFDGGIYRTS